MKCIYQACHKNYGPYSILQKLGPVTFKLKLPYQMKVHPVFHASKLIPYHKDKFAGRNPPKQPFIEVKGQEKYKVKKILREKGNIKNYYYFIK